MRINFLTVKAKARAFFIAAALGTVLLQGCTTTKSASHRQLVANVEAQYYWGRGTFLTLNAPLPSGTPEDWSRQANDSKLGRQKRRLAAALLFGAFTKTGFNSREMRAALPDPRWLENCRLTTVHGGGGNWYWFKDGTHYQLELFPQRQYDPTWVIYLTLSVTTPTEDKDAVQIGLDFLRGNLPDLHVKLAEFVLVYPMPGSRFGHIEERHDTNGVGIKFSPGDWFE